MVWTGAGICNDPTNTVVMNRVGNIGNIVSQYIWILQIFAFYVFFQLTRVDKKVNKINVQEQTRTTSLYFFLNLVKRKSEGIWHVVEIVENDKIQQNEQIQPETCRTSRKHTHTHTDISIDLFPSRSCESFKNISKGE